MSDNALSGLRILLVEDNLINRTVALAVLEKMGLRADMAENGKEAVERLKEADYDLVLMDVQMPEMDGLTASRIIRDPESGVRRTDVPIIAMTASDMARDVDACRAAGMNEMVAKPFEAAHLLAMIQRQTGRQPGEG